MNLIKMLQCKFKILILKSCMNVRACFVEAHPPCAFAVGLYDKNQMRTPRVRIGVNGGQMVNPLCAIMISCIKVAFAEYLDEVTRAYKC